MIDGVVRSGPDVEDVDSECLSTPSEGVVEVDNFDLKYFTASCRMKWHAAGFAHALATAVLKLDVIMCVYLDRSNR